MDRFVINGGVPLCGSVTINGAKNAAVAIVPAAILAEDICIIENLPEISDITIMIRMVQEMGAKVRVIDKNTIEIDSRSVLTQAVPFEMARKMRASYYFIGALLGRFGVAKVPLPGGCDFGDRPINLHVLGFEALGATVKIEGSMVEARADMLIGSSVFFDTISVGATMNVMLAAVKAKGMTIIENAAKEPHIVDLANFLNSMGADVRGAGTDVIKIRGVEKMHGARYSIIPDQIEAGTYMAAAVATGGNILIKNVIPKHLESISAKIIAAGGEVEEYDDSIRVWRTGPILKTNIKTMPHPGFPTDMQPQITAVLALAHGTSIVTESVWDHRFRYVSELRKMGANIQVDGKVAVVEGVENLIGAIVRANDLRAGAAMMIAAFCANGTTEIEDIQYIERGYENVIEKFRSLGADICKKTIPGAVVPKVG